MPSDTNMNTTITPSVAHAQRIAGAQPSTWANERSRTESDQTVVSVTGGKDKGVQGYREGRGGWPVNAPPLHRPGPKGRHAAGCKTQGARFPGRLSHTLVSATPHHRERSKTVRPITPEVPSSRRTR